MWQIFARTDVPLLQEWMQDHANEFLHAGEHPSGFDLLEPICHQVSQRSPLYHIYLCLYHPHPIIPVPCGALRRQSSHGISLS